MKQPYDIGPPYMINYNHKGKTYCFTLGADDWEDAQERLRSIGYNGEVVGSGVQTYRTNPVTLPFVALWVPLLTWWRNLRRPSDKS